MGANSSSHSGSPPTKARQQMKDHRLQQDVVRGTKLTAADDSHRHGTNIHIGSQVTAPTSATKSSAAPRVTVHTDIPTSPSVRRQQVGHNSTNSISDSEEDVKKAPVTIRSVPALNVPANESKQKANPTKHNNVKDRVSKFTELTVPQDQRKRMVSSHGNLHESSNHFHLSVPRDPSMRRGSEASALKHLRVVKTEMQPRQHDRVDNYHGERRGSEPTVLGDHQRHNRQTTIAVPPPDYDDNTEPNSSKRTPAVDKLQRMSTLEYFDQLTRREPLLTGFEKAKPARMNKAKAHSPMPSRAYQQRTQKGDNELRPKSMFLPPTSYSSDLDISRGNRSSASTDDIVSTNEGEPEVEMRKKMAGQRLPIGEVDKQTESKFLLSLKRNIELKQARATHIANCRPTSRSLENMVF